jgi:hypothetical protein
MLLLFPVEEGFGESWSNSWLWNPHWSPGQGATSTASASAGGIDQTASSNVSRFTERSDSPVYGRVH